MASCEIETQSELEPKTRILVAFDLDGSIFHGPDSWVSILKHVFKKSKKAKSKNPYPHSSSEHQSAKPLLQILSHSIRHINQDIFQSLSFLRTYSDYNQIPLNMTVISGRSEQTLGQLTQESLEKQGLKQAFFQDNIHLKPDNIPSWQWKFEKMQEMIEKENYTQAFLFENDPVAAVKIALEAKEGNLPIHILLHQGRLESSKLVLNTLGLDLNTLAELNIHLVSISQIPTAIDSILFPNQIPN